MLGKHFSVSDELGLFTLHERLWYVSSVDTVVSVRRSVLLSVSVVFNTTSIVRTVPRYKLSVENISR